MKGILETTTPKDLLNLDWRALVEGGVDVTEQEFRYIFGLLDALWTHNGDPKMPHAELVSKRHSNGYVNCSEPFSYPSVTNLMAHQIARVIRSSYDGKIDWVVGSAHASATFSFAVASILGARHEFTEKTPQDDQVWKRHKIKEGEVVLQCEDLMTTSKTTLAVRNGIIEGNPDPVTFAPIIGVLVHRSSLKEVNGTPIVYAYHLDIATWGPEECPLCKEGSEVLRPKEHWARLTGKI